MKTCDNCKYNTGFRYPDPCMSCEFLADNRNNWEPIESESTTYNNGVWETEGDE